MHFSKTSMKFRKLRTRNQAENFGGLKLAACDGCVSNFMTSFANAFSSPKKPEKHHPHEVQRVERYFTFNSQKSVLRLSQAGLQSRVHAKQAGLPNDEMP